MRPNCYEDKFIDSIKTEECNFGGMATYVCVFVTAVMLLMNLKRKSIIFFSVTWSLKSTVTEVLSFSGTISFTFFLSLTHTYINTHIHRHGRTCTVWWDDSKPWAVSVLYWRERKNMRSCVCVRMGICKSVCLFVSAEAWADDTSMAQWDRRS